MAGLEMRRPGPPCACSAPVLTPPAPPRVVDPGEPVIIAWVGNILDPLATRQVCTIKAGATLGDALRVFVPLAPSGFEVVACLNGDLLPTPRHDLVLLPGDSLAMTARPHGGGGGGGGSNSLQMVAMVAVMVVASAVTYGVGGAAFAGLWGSVGMGTLGLGAVAGAAAGMATMLLGGMLVSTAFKTRAPDFGGFGSASEALGNSPTYSWQAQANTLNEGTVLPVLYGRFMVTPPLIARNVDSAGRNQHLNLLYALAGHRIDAVEKVLINDQEISTYRDAVLETRMGDTGQSVIPFFGDLKEEIAISAKLTTEWTMRSLPGSVQGFAVGIAYRLYYANNDGGMSYVTAQVQMECRLKGTNNWIRYTSKKTAPVVVTKYRWSAGYFNNYEKWIEVEAGSDNEADHAIGDEYVVETHNHAEGQDWCDYDNTCTRKVYYWRWLGSETLYQPDGTGEDFITLSSNDQNQLRQVIYYDHIPQGEYEIRMRLVYALSESARHGSDVVWDFAQAIQYDDFSYPCTALAGIRALATDQISGSQPTVKFLVRRDTVQVWNPTAKKYEQRAATNPAWACYDALHNGAAGHPDPACYGLGVPHDRIIYADFEEWAAWCDARGHTVNTYLDSAMNGKAALDLLGVMGRGSVIQIGSRFTCTVDRPVDLPRQTFLVGLGNICQKTFKKAWLPLQERANVVELTYFDEEANWQRQTVECYQDGFDTSARSAIRTQRTLYGCTSRAAAVRFGRGLMLRNRYLTYMPSFETGVEGIHCLCGDVIELADDTLHGCCSGRILAADGASVTLDTTATLLPGVQYALEVQDIDTDERLYAYAVGTATEKKTDLITLVTDWRKIPGAGSKYSFGEVGRTKRAFRILSMQTAQDQRKRLNLLEYVPEVYDEDQYELPEEDWSDRAFVRGLKLVEIWQPGGPDGSGRSKIGVTWRGTALRWNVWIREEGRTWRKAGATSVPNFEISERLIIGHTYEVAVSVGTPETGQRGLITLRGKQAPPSDVTGFRAVALDGQAVLTWNHIPDADLWGYEIRMGKTWETGLTAIDGVQENSARWTPPMDGTFRFWIKAIDLSGLYSVNAAEASVTIDISASLNVVWQADELPGGVPDATLERLVSLSGGERLSWIPSMTDADFPPWYTDASIGYYCGDTAPGIYTSQVYDLQAVTPFNLRMYAEFDAELVGATDLTYPDRTDLSYPADADLHITSLSRYRAFYRLSDDAETWSAWQDWTGPHDLSGRFLQLRFATDLDAVGVHFEFTRLAEMADVPEQAAIFTAEIPAEGRTFSMQEIGFRPILMLFHVGVTVLGTAALYPVVDKAQQAFTVTVFDTAGNPHAAEASIEVRGF